jgi:hypothetical protein
MITSVLKCANLTNTYALLTLIKFYTIDNSDLDTYICSIVSNMYFTNQPTKAG